MAEKRKLLLTERSSRLFETEKLLMIKLTVNASRKYDVVMERGMLGKAGEYIGKANGRKICIITDDNVDKLYGQSEHALWGSLTSAGFDVYKYVFPGGEDHKNMATVTGILEFLAEHSFTRSDLLMPLRYVAAVNPVISPVMPPPRDRKSVV